MTTLQNRGGLNARRPKVSVHMPAYNHEAYIAEAIESVLSQKTDFRFELVIGEDCSTDGTRAVARGYARQHPEQILLLEHSHNLGIWENDQSILRACRGEYIAWLEGDDYWCSDTKLQRQVDLLDRHADMSACFHRAGSVSEKPLPVTWRNGPADSKPVYTLDDLLEQGHFVPSCTAVFRRALARPPMVWTRQTSFLEVTYFAHFAKHGVIGFLDEKLAKFRYHDRGVYGTATRAEHLRRAIEAHRLVGRHLGLEARSSYARGLARMREELAETLAAAAET
jgi:glycosyltransferase involved in cell wall biosynthesis